MEKLAFGAMALFAFWWHFRQLAEIRADVREIHKHLGIDALSAAKARFGIMDKDDHLDASSGSDGD